MLPRVFLKYAEIFANNGYSLYMVGGSTRDYLLNLPVRDLDFVTDATPEEVQRLLPEANARFAKYGVMSIKDEEGPIDIVTFRAEMGYEDSRHPNRVVFVKDMYLDSCRRDFTINALYIDAHGNVYDFHGGLKDLRDNVIRFVGEPNKRVREDPLRILRARRFANRLHFEIAQSTEKAIEDGEPLLDKINPEKVFMERKKE